MSADLVKFYQDLITTQYWDKPNAKAEIGVIAKEWSNIYDFLKSWNTEFDLDEATGHRLDIIGKIVGLPREVPFVVSKIRFSFDGNPNGVGLADKFNPTKPGAIFFDKFENQYSSQQLDDYDYQFFIKAKIAVNVAAAFMASKDRISIQDSIQTTFGGLAFGKDNEDMSLTVYVSAQVSAEKLRLIRQLDLLPKPQGVRYKVIIQAEPFETFSFFSNPNGRGLADKFDTSKHGGYFATKLI